MPEPTSQGEQLSLDSVNVSPSNSASAPGSGSPPTPTSGQDKPAPQPAQPEQQAATRPNGVPDKYWKDNKVDFPAWEKDHNEAIAFRAAEESRRLQIPKPEAYKVELPKDFTPPDGVKFEFNQNDPLLAQARTMAHEMGISQENFSRLLGLYAGAQVTTQQQVNTARNAEIAKLGATGTARVDALGTFFRAQLGDAEGKQFMSRLFTASDVQIAEKILAKMQGGSSGNGFRQTGREAPEAPGRRSPEEIARMSPRERLDYSRTFDQSKMPEWRDPRAA